MSKSKIYMPDGRVSFDYFDEDDDSYSYKAKIAMDKVKNDLRQMLESDGENWSNKHSEIYHKIIRKLSSKSLKPLFDLIDEADKAVEQSKGAEEIKKKYNEMTKTIIELEDPRAREAIKFAERIGEVYRRNEDVATQISYSVWAYLGGQGNPFDADERKSY